MKSRPNPPARRFALAALAFSLTCATARAQPAYELWPCGELPEFEAVFFLPIFTPEEPPAFVDLGTAAITHGGQSWKALQFTRDKQIAVSVPAGAYLFGLLGDEWPAGSVNVWQELHAVRLVAIEIDGDFHSVDPDCLLDLSSDEGSVAFYDVLPRFLAPGSHSLRYYWRQVRDFYFIYPFDALGIPDPAGLDGRRVFPKGETAGSTLDGFLVLDYAVTVVGP